MRQIIDGTNYSLISDIDEHFRQAENDIGAFFVRTLAQLFIVTPHGLTTLEILDALTISDEMSNLITGNNSLSIRLHTALDKLG